MTTICWKLPAIYVIARYKASNFSKIKQDLPSLFSIQKTKYIRSLKIALAAYNLWQNSCKTQLPRKKIVVESINVTIQTSKYINEN